MMSRSTDLLTVGRAAALFSSDLSASVQVTPDQVEAAIRHAVRTYGSVRDCTAEVAAAYGERPETAASRMRWARRIVEGLYARPGERAAELVTVLPRRPSGKGTQDVGRALVA
jgi:hypothetical protein